MEIKMSTWLIIGLILLIGIILFRDKIFSLFKKKEKELPPTEKPLPKPEPITEPEKPKPEPEPIPEPEPKPDPEVFEIVSPGEDVDSTIYVRDKIAEVSDGTKEVPNIIKFTGRFWTEGGKKGVFVIENRHNLIIQGGTFYTKAPAVAWGSSVSNNTHSQRRHFSLRFCSNITFNEVTVEGSNRIDGRLIGTTPELTPDFWKGGKDKGSIAGAPAYVSYWEGEHAFESLASTDIAFNGCTVFGVWGDGVYVGEQHQYDPEQDKYIGVPSKNITIKNCHLKFTGRQGIAAGNSVDGLVIEDNNIDLGRRASIDLEPHTRYGYARNVIIRNNKLHAVQTAIAALGNGDVSDIQIIDNEFSGGGFVIAGDSDRQNPILRKNWIVKGNTRANWFGSPQASSTFYHMKNIEYSGNHDKVSSKQKQVSVMFTECEGELIVEDNNFYGGEWIYTIENKSEIQSAGNNPEQKIREVTL